MDKPSVESPAGHDNPASVQANHPVWPTVVLSLSMTTYLGILAGVPLAFCLFGDVYLFDLFQSRYWKSLLSSGFASYLTVLAIWCAIGPLKWHWRTLGATIFVFVGFLVSFASYSECEPIHVRRVNDYMLARYGQANWMTGGTVPFTVFLRELLFLIPWFAVMTCALLAVRCWFGWVLRRSEEPVGRRNARRVRMFVLLSIVAVTLSTHLSLQLRVFGRDHTDVVWLVVNAAFITVPTAFLIAAIIWAMFSRGRPKTRWLVAGLVLATVLAPYVWWSFAMFSSVNRPWLWQILIAAESLVPFFGALFAIRGFGYRITPYSRDDFISAESEQRLSPFDT